jgi:hypothetical protein
MKLVLTIIFLFSVPFLISCGSCNHTSENKLESNINKQNNPTAIVQNISVVTARIDAIEFTSETDYKIKATVLTVEEKSDKPSIAVPGNEYVLQPNFRYDDRKLLENDVNSSLKSLSKLEKGKTFKAEISLENQKGWFIQNVLAD